MQVYVSMSAPKVQFFMCLFTYQYAMLLLTVLISVNL
jgi:hypothetical protein